MPLPENLRQEYLEALGIACYYPRLQLPGAPVSELAGMYVPSRATSPAATPAVLPEPQETAAKPAPQTVAKTPQKPVEIAPVKSPVGKPAEKHQAKKALETGTRRSTASRQAPGEEVKLQLCCIRASATLAVITAMPHLGPRQLSARHQALLANLLAACGIPGSAMTVDDKPFRWPMVNGLHVDNSKRAAAAALKAYLHQKRMDWQFSRLLVMGETVIYRLLEPEDKAGSDVSVDKPLARDDCEIVYTRGLDELLQRPALKKDTWVHIRKRIT